MSAYPMFALTKPPILALDTVDRLRAACDTGARTVACSLDLERTTVSVDVGITGWTWAERTHPWPSDWRPRTLYALQEDEFRPIARYGSALVKLVPTAWGAPTFEIDGIKMLPTAALSPFLDARHKVELIQPQGKRILDTCGGLGYFAACCIASGAHHVTSYEKNPDVLWLREFNPWSPATGPTLDVKTGDIAREIVTIPTASCDAILHDPPRFAIAGELYSGEFYAQLARVLKPRGLMFHYTGSPNANSRGRDLAGEVMRRLHRHAFSTQRSGDGVFAIRA